MKKLIGLNISEFNKAIEAKEISVQKATLIPLFKNGEERALSSIFMSTLRLVKEFRSMFLKSIEVNSVGQVYVYTEVTCAEAEENFMDGLLLMTNSSGVIKDAVLFEMKATTKPLELPQLEKYFATAKEWGIQKFVTITNDFVSSPTQYPIEIKVPREIKLSHFSWFSLMTNAELLINDGIQDLDQKEILKEVLAYFSNDKSGVNGFDKMKNNWSSAVEKIRVGNNISDQELDDSVLSWHQEECHVSQKLALSSKDLVYSGDKRNKESLKERLTALKKDFTNEAVLYSTFNFKNEDLCSDLDVKANLKTRVVEMSFSVKLPTDKGSKAQMNWLKKQLDECRKEKDYKEFNSEIMLWVSYKGTSIPKKGTLEKFENLANDVKDLELKDVQIIYPCDVGTLITQPKKFVEKYETALLGFFNCFLKNFEVYEAKAIDKPKMEKTIVQETTILQETTVFEDGMITKTETEINNVTVVSTSQEMEIPSIPIEALDKVS